MTDNGARALAERLRAIGIMEEPLPGWTLQTFADRLLANGAVFLPVPDYAVDWVPRAIPGGVADKLMAAGLITNGTYGLFLNSEAIVARLDADAAELERLRRIEAAARRLDRAYGPRSVGMVWTATQEMIDAWRELQEAAEGSARDGG